jgi:transposase
MSDFKLSPEEINELKELHKSLKNKKVAYRINAIILLGSGQSFEEVASNLLLNEKTVKRYLETFQKGGINLLISTFYRGGIPKLTEDEETKLKEHLDNHLLSSAKEVVDYVSETFNVDFTPEGMVITLHRLGYSYKKTKLKPSKADKEKQKAFVKDYELLKSELKDDEKVYFMDGVHPTHNVRPAYAWIKIGKEREVDCNTGRQRVNINGVYSPQDHEVITIESDRINAQSTIELLKKIEIEHPELETIYIIRDNARYYCAKLVKEYLETSKIKMVPLPSYSPNLNLIERLWKFFKKKVLANEYYSTFDLFKGAVREFFKNINKFDEELSTLMTEKFHIV